MIVCFYKSDVLYLYNCNNISKDPTKLQGIYLDEDHVSKTAMTIRHFLKSFKHDNIQIWCLYVSDINLFSCIKPEIYCKNLNVCYIF